MSFLKGLLGSTAAKRAVVQPSGAEFQIARGETILESALKLGLAYPHDCTVGTCGSCRTKLIQGRVEAITPFAYTLSRDELDAGYILACQALPKSDVRLEVVLSSREQMVAATHKARLAAIEDLTHDIKRLVFTIDTPLRFKAGQYANLRWDGSGEHRSYSFAMPPARDGSTEVSTFVRHVPGGLFTDMLFRGDPLEQDYEIEGPHGNFWLREGSGPIVCVAGGSGLAPLVSLLQDAANRRVRRDCVLLFGARTQRDLYAHKEIEAIRSAWTASFDFWPVLSEEPVAGYRDGFVTDHLPAALAKLGAGAQGYMCGPPAMIDAGVHALAAQGVPLDDIHYDKFTDASTRGPATGETI